MDGLKRLIIIGLVSGLILGVLIAAEAQDITDSGAMARARMLWGSIAKIGYVRGVFDTYWTKLVGYDSQGCYAPFTVLGSGLNTWEASFSTVQVGAVKGPFAGTVSVEAQAWDNTAIVGVQFQLDGKPLGAEIVPSPPSQTVNASILWDTTTVPEGIHAVCVTARDDAGNVGRSFATLANVSQNLPPIGTTLRIGASDGLPVFSMAK